VEDGQKFKVQKREREGERERERNKERGVGRTEKDSLREEKRNH
jgi:hypothetical protein